MQWLPYAAAFVAFLFAASGPVAIILSVGARGGLPSPTSRLDLRRVLPEQRDLDRLHAALPPAAHFPVEYPGGAVGLALAHLSFPEVIGAFATGVLMVLLGLSGWVRRAMDAVPMPIVMAMVAGVFLRFGIDLVLAFPAALDRAAHDGRFLCISERTGTSRR